MAETYKHSYKSGEILMTSLSVYNTGYQRCEAGYQWGPGVRDHYCIHHILSGTGYYTVGEKTWKLEAGDTFILYPGVEVKIEHAEGLADCKKILSMAKIGRMNGCLIEGMGCPGGCVAGAGTNIPVPKAQKKVQEFVKASSKQLPPKELGEIELK